MGEARFAYFDTQARTGLYTELVYVTPDLKAWLERLKRGD
jgi:hypothetical protein